MEMLWEQGLGALAWRKLPRRSDTRSFIKHHRELGKEGMGGERSCTWHRPGAFCQFRWWKPGGGERHWRWKRSGARLGKAGFPALCSWDSVATVTSGHRRALDWGVSVQGRRLIGTRVNRGNPVRERSVVMAQTRDDKGPAGRNEGEQRIWKHFCDDEN